MMDDEAQLMANHLILDGLPALDSSKRETFLKVLKAKMAERLKAQNIQNFEVTLSQDSAGTAFAIVEFVTTGDAEKAFPLLNKWRLTRADEFKCYYWSDFDRFANVPEEFQDTDVEETLNKSELKANDFLLDPEARAQFILKGGADMNVEWYYLGKKKTADLIKKPNAAKDDDISTWSEVDHTHRELQKGIPHKMPMWSPQGTFLVTQHRDGLGFWGGRGLKFLSEILVDDLQYVGISPSETFAITYSRSYDFWNILEGRKIRSLPGETAMKKGNSDCPFKYNYDDTIVATANLAEKGKETISMYEAHTMKLISPELQKFTARFPGLRQFDWSPSNARMFACVMEGDGNTGWCVEVNLVDAEGEIRNVGRRPLQDVRYSEDTNPVVLQWHPDGGHAVLRILKQRSGQEFFDYLILTVTERSVVTHPVESPLERTAKKSERHELPKILRFWWTAGFPRFAILYEGAKATNNLQSIIFFQVEATGCRPIGEINQQRSEGFYDSLFWSPKGTECVCLNQTTYNMDFYAVNETSVRRVSTKENQPTHKGSTHYVWDPSGRYFCSYVSTVEQAPLSEVGYRVWSSYGDLLVENNNMKTRFSHLYWRPQPRTLLTREEQAELEKELPKLREKYEAEDTEIERKAQEKQELAKTEVIRKYKEVMTAIAKHHDEKGFKATREALRASAPAMKRQIAFLEKHKETVTETSTKEIIISEAEQQ